MGELLAFVLVVLAWVGHACIWTALLNNLYGRPLSKGLLKLWRFATGGIILAFPLLLWSIRNVAVMNLGPPEDHAPFWGLAMLVYTILCLVFSVTIFLPLTIERALRKPPACLVAESTHTIDLWPELGHKLIGDGKGRPFTHLPGNCVFKLDVTELTLAVPNLPPEWDGLTILVISDLHFHGTPSRVYFERVLAEVTTGAPHDLVCLVGDYVDTDTHYEWIGPLLGRLCATEAKLAILGNHDVHHQPDRIRAELTRAGCIVLSNNWRELTIRGVKCVAVGHEGPWFAPPPDLSEAPAESFRLCLSHTPDNFYWAQENRINLVLCGHVHGGAIRVPLIGSIFVPSLYGRRFDQGVFEENATIMVISRGVSGKEPLRYRCNPQVLRVTLQIPHSAKTSG